MAKVDSAVFFPSGRRRLGFNLLLLCLFLILLLLDGGRATAATVVIVTGEDAGPQREVADALRAALEKGGGGKLSVAVATAGAPRTTADLYVALGTRAAEALMNAEAPVLAALVQRQTFELLARRRAASESKPFSAIFLDQPWDRQLGLIRHALPGKRRVGVLLGPESAGQLKAMQAAAREQGLQLRGEAVDGPDALIPALRRLLEDTDVLLAVPDPVAINRSTAQPVLLTAYRYLKPVFGFSQAYVKAGALAAVHTTPAQIAQQVADAVLQAASSSWQLPPPRYPREMTVSVNRQVAHSLGLTVETETLLQDRLKQLE